MEVKTAVLWMLSIIRKPPMAWKCMLIQPTHSAAGVQPLFWSVHSIFLLNRFCAPAAWCFWPVYKYWAVISWRIFLDRSILSWGYSGLFLLRHSTTYRSPRTAGGIHLTSTQKATMHSNAFHKLMTRSMLASQSFLQWLKLQAWHEI